MKIYLASSNKGKIEEISSIFKNYEIVSQKQLDGYIEPEENGTTFEGNSKIKAQGIYKFLKKLEQDDLIIADDSGIIIPNLGDNRLGVFTKREMKKWVEENNKTEDDFWVKIVQEANIGAEAKFKAAITVIDGCGKEKTIVEELVGNLTYPRGENGFAFDVILEYEGKTLAERTFEEKQKINPRINALRRI